MVRPRYPHWVSNLFQVGDFSDNVTFRFGMIQARFPRSIALDLNNLSHQNAVIYGETGFKGDFKWKALGFTSN